MRQPLGRAQSLKIALTQPVQAAYPGAHPDATLTIAQNRPDLVTRQTARSGNCAELIPMLAANSGTPGADPQIACGVKCQGSQLIGGQPVCHAIGRDLPLLDVNQASTGGGRPDAAVRVCQHKAHLQVRESIARVQHLKAPRRIRHQAATRGGDPQHPSAVKGQRAQAVGGQPLGLLVQPGNPVAPMYQAIFCSRPDGAIGCLGKCIDALPSGDLAGEHRLKDAVAVPHGTLSMCNPQALLTVLHETKNRLTSHLGGLGHGKCAESSPIKSGQPASRSNPKVAILSLV